MEFTFQAVRRNLSGVDTRNVDYMFPATVPTKVGWSTHGGEDVAVYADGERRNDEGNIKLLELWKNGEGSIKLIA